MGTLVKLDGDAGRWYSHLTLGLQTLRSSNALCDASLVSQDGHVVPVHSVVMAAGSSVLETLMKSNRNDDNDENHVFLDDVTTGSILTSIVDFVYTASCDVSSKHLDELCSAARALKLHHLQELCVKKFKGAANALTSMTPAPATITMTKKRSPKTTPPLTTMMITMAMETEKMMKRKLKRT